MPAVKLLSTPGIFLGAERAAVPRGKTSALLYYLAYQKDWVSREDILYLFWPDTEEQKARNNLRQLLSSIRKLPFTKDLETNEQNLRWLIPSDARSFKETIEQKQWTNAIKLYHGPLLKDFRAHQLPEFENWLELERAELLRVFKDAALQLGQDFMKSERYSDAVDVLNKVLEQDPFDEISFRLYLRAIFLSEGQEKAKQELVSYQKALAHDLGAEPEAATLKLFENLMDVVQDNETQIVAIGVRTLEDKPLHNLPFKLTPFVGRAKEKSELNDYLANPACRLVTLLGPGGMGKTRLALAVAEEQLGSFEHGVWFAPFDALENPNAMLYPIAEALNFRFYGQDDPKEQLLNYLSSKDMLLVLDNLEHLLEGAPFITDLLENAPKLKVLATSRELLNLQAEHVFEVGGLNLEQQDEASDAKRLFLQSAKKRKRGLDLEDDSPAINKICSLVEGMPLAIELAAGWLSVLTPEAIASELEQGLGILEGQTRDTPERHQSVRAVFEHSWTLLPERERDLLAKLAVFRGGFTRDAAKTITQVSLPSLLGLSNKSFLRRDDTGRFTQHPLMWQFAREKVKNNLKFQILQENHSRYFANFLKEREQGQEGLDAQSIRQEITLEFANILAAWNWMVENRREDLLNLALWSLCEYYRGENRFQEGEILFSLTEGQLDKNSILRARLLHRLGLFHNMLGSYDEGLDPLKESLSISKKQKSVLDEAFARFVYCMNRDFARDISREALIANLQDCAELFRQAGDHYQEAWTLQNLAVHLKDLDERERINRHNISVFRERKRYFALTHALNHLALFVAKSRGDFQEANVLFEEAILIDRKRNHAFHLVWWLTGYGHNLIYQGDYEKAKQYFQEALVLSKSFDLERGVIRPAKGLHGLGLLAILQQDYHKANALLQEALVSNKVSGDPIETAYTLTTCCNLAIIRQEFSDAGTLCQQVEVQLRRTKRRSNDWFEVSILNLNNLAKIAMCQGDLNCAAQHLHLALEKSQEWHNTIIQLDLLLTYAILAKQQGKDDSAADLFDFIMHHKACTFATRQTAQERLDATPKMIKDGMENYKDLELEQVIEDILAL